MVVSTFNSILLELVYIHSLHLTLLCVLANAPHGYSRALGFDRHGVSNMGRQAVSGAPIKTLVADLRAASSEERQRAAKQLALIAGKDNDHGEEGGAARVLRSGALPALVFLVQSETHVGCQTHAASTLANLAAAGYQDAVAQAGAVVPLVTLTRASSQQGAASAVAALSSLAEVSSLRESLIKAGILTPLVRLMKVGLTEARIHAALAIGNLAQECEGTQAAVEAAGALPLLISMLPSGKAQQAAATALAKTCGSKAIQESIAREGGIAPLLSLLNGVNIQVQVAAAAAIAALARDNETIQTTIAKAGGVGPLLAMLSTRSPQAQARGAGALAQLARHHPDNQESIARLGGLPTLVGLLTPQNDANVQAMAAMAIAETCRGLVDNQTAVAELGALSSLVVLLRTTSSGSAHGYGDADDDDDHGVQSALAEEVKAEAAGAVWVLADSHHANKVSLVASGALPPLVSLLASGDARGQLHAAKALASLGRDSVANQKQITSLLVALLGSGSPAARSRCGKWRSLPFPASARASARASHASHPLPRPLPPMHHITDPSRLHTDSASLRTPPLRTDLCGVEPYARAVLLLRSGRSCSRTLRHATRSLVRAALQTSLPS